MADGWLKLWRKLRDNPYLRDAAQRAVFVTLLIDAEHKPRERHHSKGVVMVGRGQALISERALADELNLGREPTRRVLRNLKKGGLINPHTTPHYTLITICNFERYQSSDGDGQPTLQPTGQPTPNPHPNPTLRREEEGEGKKESLSNVVAIDSTSSPGTNLVPSAKPKRRQVYPDEFERFWLVYPQRPTDTKRLAFVAWQKAVASGVDPPTLQSGAERYGQFCRRTGHESMLVATWCSDKRQGWTASYEGNGIRHGRQSTAERIAGRLRAEGEDLFGPDGPVVESRSARWR